jgi:hypothetical protein
MYQCNSRSYKYLYSSCNSQVLLTYCHNIL